MKLASTTVTLVSITGYALAAPAADLVDRDLEARANPGDSQSNPIKGEIAVRGEDALTYEVDCWAMVCKDKPTVM